MENPRKDREDRTRSTPGPMRSKYSCASCPKTQTNSRPAIPKTCKQAVVSKNTNESQTGAPGRFGLEVSRLRPPDMPRKRNVRLGRLHGRSFGAPRSRKCEAGGWVRLDVEAQVELRAGEASWRFV